MSTSDKLQVITAITALVAVVVGPLVSIWIARRQIRASVISPSRQAWINSLRDAITDYLAKQQIARNQNYFSHADAASLPRIEEIVRLNTRIELLINPNEADHARLAEMVSEMTNTTNRSAADAKGVDIDRQRAEVIALSQSILKREWERVKRGN